MQPFQATSNTDEWHLGESPTSRLHLVIPATSTNIYLCQLFLSAAILGYPAPTLINWGAAEDEDKYVQHLAKVEGILNYLTGIPPEQENDLVLVIDGYDTWLQLPPDILIQRYYAVVEGNARMQEELFYNQVITNYTMKNTVIFGPDKLCWPVDPLRASCWAVPESPLHPQAFGPDTDHGIVDHNRPRWLNSGTILGPAHDLQRVFTATLAMIRDTYSGNSDQLYFSQLFAEQSYARRLHQMQYAEIQGEDVSIEREELLPSPPPPAGIDSKRQEDVDDSEHSDEPPLPKDIPQLDPNSTYEYHIGLDYNSTLFQTVAYYEDYITWINNSRISSTTRSRPIPHHTFPFPADLSRSGPLVSSIQTLRHVHASASPAFINTLCTAPPPNSLPSSVKSWFTLPLALNTITQQIFPVLHFTGKKGYRDLWWRRNWFYPYLETLLDGRRRLLRQARNAEIQVNGGVDNNEMEIVDGAWTDGVTRRWLDWREVCRVEFERELMGLDLYTPGG